MPSLETLTPAGKRWFVWLILAGRGWGKTRTAVENIADMVRGPSPLIAPPGAPKLISIIADNPSDMRQFSIEGPSGFKNVGPSPWRPQHFPSVKTLEWPNGIKAMLFSAEDPESLRGASGEFFWWDELAKSRYEEEGWSNLMFGMREGRPRGIVTTTPRPKMLLVNLVEAKSTIVTRGSTLENEENLADEFIEEVIKPQLETRRGRQEIHAEILLDVPGALWTREMVDAIRLSEGEAAPKKEDMKRIVVAVDPSGTDGKDKKTGKVQSLDDRSNDVGIVVVGLDNKDQGWVLEDCTINEGPEKWAKAACDAYDRWDADKIIGEKNFGGAMVRSTIHAQDPKVNFGFVIASRGKALRAEPVANLYSQQRVRHVRGLTRLEEQLYQMTPAGFEGSGSPDRLDAMVWGVTELMLKKFKRRKGAALPEIF